MPFILTPAQRAVWESDIWQKCKYIQLEGGSRSTKTSLIIFNMLMIAQKYPFSRQLICRQQLTDVKTAVMQDTIPKVSRLIGAGFAKMVENSLNKADYKYKFPNHSEIWLAGVGNVEQSQKILGTEYCTIFFSETSQMPYSAVENFFTRNALNIEGFINRFYFDLNPPLKSHWSYKLFHEKVNPIDRSPKKKESLYGYRILNPKDNPHLPPDYIEDVLEGLSERQQKRYLHGEYQSEVEGALWTIELIERNRVYELPDMERIVIGCDPALTSEKKSNETGIVVCGINGRTGYVMADLSGRYKPLEWAKMIEKAFHDYDAHAIIVEDNAGADLIEQNLNLVDTPLPIIRVHARSGKALRAEPIVALYQQGRIKHFNTHGDLEDQMVSHVFNFETFRAMYQGSPDRIDATVYALWELMISTTGGFTKIY